MKKLNKDIIKKIFPDGENHKVVINQDNKFLDWERAGVMFDNNLIPSQYGLHTEIIIQNSNSDMIFKIEWAIFDNLAYIHWININKKYRKRGISSTIRKEVIDWIFSYGCVEIFTIPSTEAGRKLARSQGFTKTKIQPGNPEYTVYSRHR